MSLSSFRARLIVVLIALACVLLLTACKSEQDKVRDAVNDFMDTYAACAPSDEGEEAESDQGDKDGKDDKDKDPAPDFGDASTIAFLEAYGIDSEEYHEHALAHFSYEVGDVTVSEDGTSATAVVSITNADLNAAMTAATSDFEAWVLTDEMQQTLDSSGKAGLVEKLVSFLYQRLDADDASVVTTEVTLSLTKDDDGNWTVDTPLGEQFFSALYGGSELAFDEESVGEQTPVTEVDDAA